MTVSTLSSSITCIQTTHQGYFFATHAFHDTPLGPLCTCGPVPCGPSWALVGPTVVDLPLGLCGSPEPLWAAPLWTGRSAPLWARPL